MTPDSAPHPNPAQQIPARKFPISPLAGVVLVVAIYFGAIVLGQLLVSVYAGLRFRSVNAANDWITNAPAAQFAFGAVVTALTLLAAAGVMRSAKVTRADIGLLRPRFRDGIFAVAAYPVYFGLNAAVLFGGAALFHLNLDQRQQTGFENAVTSPDLIFTFVSLVLLPPLVEEIIMRGFLFGSLRGAMSVVKAAVVTSIIFAAAHLQFGSGAPLLWAAAIDTFILSLVLCFLRVKTGSLWAGITLHMLKNCLAFMALFIFKG